MVARRGEEFLARYFRVFILSFLNIIDGRGTGTLWVLPDDTDEDMVKVYCSIKTLAVEFMRLF